MNFFTSHHFKIAFRRLVKEHKYTLLNIIGLALGMAAALLIMLYLMFELSYDKYHQDHEKIYRIGADATISGERTKIAINSVGIGPMMVDQLPDFQNYMRIFPANYFFRNLVYRYDDKSFYEEGVFATDSTFFDFFTFEFIYGQAHNALNEPFSIVMTRSMCERYFDDENPIGKMIEVEGAGSFMVTAVIEDPPLNSHFQFDGLFSMATMYHLDHLLADGFMAGVTWPMLETNHGSRIVWVYLKTTLDFAPEEFTEKKWFDFYHNHIGHHEIYEDNRLIFQPMADIHLKSKLSYEMTSETGAVTMMSPEMIRIFFLVAVFLLLLASINYTNISISQFNRRSKEVGVKKVLGATRKNLIVQFLAEAIITTIGSLIVALLLVEVFTPMVNNLLGVSLSLNVIENPKLLLIFASIAVFVGIIAGGYPAVYFSSFKPLKVLRHRFQSGKHTLTLKKSLIVLQFVISVFMIIATVVVARQMQYINNKDLGYDRDHMVILELKDDFSRNSAETLKNELIKSPHVRNAALSNYVPSIMTVFSSLDIENQNGHQSLSANIVQVSPEYMELMDLKLAEGRFFNREYRTDNTDVVVINQAAQRHFGWEEAIGKSMVSGIKWPDGTPAGQRTVVGVLEDFHYSSLTRPIEPMVLFPMRNRANYINVKIGSEDFSSAIGAIEKTWNEYRPNYPLQYFLLDTLVDGMYQSQSVLTVFFAAFAWLCIVIAFLGLYGLSAYSLEQKTREIGIRKVLGADFIHILTMLGREFIWLIIIALILACALAFYFMEKWLSSFAHHTQLDSLPFIAGIVIAIGTAFLAVFFHARRASKLNPVNSLKYE